jgi:hypothetical protein
MVATHLGFYNTATSRTHVRFQFSTHNAAGANVAPSSAIDAADLRIYKATDGAAFSATQRSSAAGITCTSPFDSLTGFHDVDIDLTDNTDAGFYASGSFYTVVLAPNDETIDSQVLTGVVLAYFEIGVQAANVTHYGGTAGTFASGVPAVNAVQISNDSAAADNLENAYDDTAGPVPWNGITDQGTAQSATSTTVVLRAAAAFADDTLIGGVISVLGSTQGYWQTRIITDNVLSTDTVTVDPAWQVTPSGTITYKLWGAPQVAIPSAVQIRTEMDANSTQLAAIVADTSEIGTAGAGLTNINLPNQTMDIVGNITGNLSGSVGSVTGAVGSVTGNVGGNVTGSVGSLAAQAKADVNAEVLDVLSTDTFGEPTGTPGATLTLREKIGWLFMALRNRIDITSTKKTFYDDGGAAEWEKDLSDDGTTYSESEGNAP